MNLHLSSNYMLREVFELGAPLIYRYYIFMHFLPVPGEYSGHYYPLPAFDAATSHRPSKTERVCWTDANTC
jgi:hypothetical protein